MRPPRGIRLSLAVPSPDVPSPDVPSPDVPSPVVLALVVLAALTGCAAPGGGVVPAASAPVASRVPPAGQGVVAAIRPVSAAARARLPGMASAPGRPRDAVEVIVREDGGGTVSVMQSDAEGLRVGSRVTLERGPRPRVTQAPPGG